MRGRKGNIPKSYHGLRIGSFKKKKVKSGQRRQQCQMLYKYQVKEIKPV